MVHRIFWIIQWLCFLYLGLEIFVYMIREFSFLRKTYCSKSENENIKTITHTFVLHKGIEMHS